MMLNYVNNADKYHIFRVHIFAQCVPMRCVSSEFIAKNSVKKSLFSIKNEDLTVKIEMVCFKYGLKKRSIFKVQ